MSQSATGRRGGCTRSCRPRALSPRARKVFRTAPVWLAPHHHLPALTPPWLRPPLVRQCSRKSALRHKARTFSLTARPSNCADRPGVLVFRAACPVFASAARVRTRAHLVDFVRMASVVRTQDSSSLAVAAPFWGSNLGGFPVARHLFTSG